jgi:hypothetical protein
MTPYRLGYSKRPRQLPTQPPGGRRQPQDDVAVALAGLRMAPRRSAIASVMWMKHCPPRRVGIVTPVTAADSVAAIVAKTDGSRALPMRRRAWSPPSSSSWARWRWPRPSTGQSSERTGDRKARTGGIIAPDRSICSRPSPAARRRPLCRKASSPTSLSDEPPPLGRDRSAASASSRSAKPEKAAIACSVFSLSVAICHGLPGYLTASAVLPRRSAASR